MSYAANRPRPHENRDGGGHRALVVAALAVALCALGACSGNSSGRSDGGAGTGTGAGSGAAAAANDDLVAPVASTVADTATTRATGDPIDGTTDMSNPQGTVPTEAPLGTDPLSSGVPDAIDITVPALPIEVAPAVEVDEEAQFGTGVSVRVASYEAIEVTSARPGEVGGEVLQLDLEFVNGSTEPVDLDSVTIDLQYGDGKPANQVTTDPADPVSGTLEPSGVLTGRYIFSVPVEQRDDVQLFVSYAASAPTIVINGSFA